MTTISTSPRSSSADGEQPGGGLTWRPAPPGPAGASPAWPPVLVAEDLLAQGVVAAFPGRAGGQSQPPFDTCNLGLRVGDEVRVVLANRRRVATVLGLAGLPWATVRQVHGTGAVRVERAALPAGPPEAKPPLAEADVLVTGEQGVVLAALVADCVPVLLVDPERRVAAAVHAGWRGLGAGVVEAAAAAFAAAGGRPPAATALVGPAAGACCYEVGDDVRERVTERYPSAAATTSSGRPALDLAAGAAEALGRAGFAAPRVAGECTVHQPERHFSYRRDGTTGRQAGIVALVPGLAAAQP